MQLLDSTRSDPFKMLLTMIKTPRRTGRSWTGLTLQSNS